MNVLITGATGFIGSELARVLRQAGHTVAALSRDPQRARDSVPELADAFEWHATEAPPPAAAVEGADAVVNLAGESVSGRWTARKKQAIRDSRVLGTRNLVQAFEAASSRPNVMVSASAIGYYGDRGEEELTEDSPPGDDFLAEVCQAWEVEARRAEDLGVRVVRLRIGVVLGEDGGALDAMLLPFKLGLGGPLGSGRQWWSWIHRHDLVALMHRALDDGGLSGAYNATSPEPVRQKQFAKQLGGVLRRPAFMPAPAFMLRLVLGGFENELLGSKKVVPAGLRDVGHEFRFPELRPALEDAVS